MKFRIVVLVSGNGTNLQILIDWAKNNLLPIDIVGVLSNKQCVGLERAERHGIENHYVDEYNNGSKIDKCEYDDVMGNLLEKMNPDLVILAGYMRLVTKHFIDRFKNIINIHPALPKQIPGANSIEDAYNLFNLGKIEKTGVMVHRVIEEMDAGEVIDSVEIPIYEDDKLEDLRERIQKMEKPLLLKSMMSVLYSLELEKQKNKKNEIISGKVRERLALDYDLITFCISDRLSSFDRHICNIKGKGRLLNLINEWWMGNTKHIIDNHLLYLKDNYMICKKCEVIPLEIIVRGYITGNTSTSLWTNYNKGVRNYCGLDLPEGLDKNQKLDKPLITPTTKGIIDELISKQQILDRKIVTEKELDFIYKKALELYEYGSYVLNKKDLILVDTKYEFGRDINGNIILIDEVHTCDSSRVWKLNTYEHNFNNNLEPDKLDKDCIRDYVKKNKLDLDGEIVIPEDLKTRVFNTYKEYYERLKEVKFEEVIYEEREKLTYDNLNNQLIEEYFNEHHKNVVVIFSGSSGDEWFIKKLRDEFYKHKIYTIEHVCSAHKETRKVLQTLEHYNKMTHRNIIFITVAGRSNALSGVASCNTHYPVIACPPLKEKGDYSVNIHSTLQMPSNTPTLTVLEPKNAVLSCKRIFQLY